MEKPKSTTHFTARRGTAVLGIFSSSALKKMVSTGELLPTDEISNNGLVWHVAGSVRQLGFPRPGNAGKNADQESLADRSSTAGARLSHHNQTINTSAGQSIESQIHSDDEAGRETTLVNVNQPQKYPPTISSVWTAKRFVRVVVWTMVAFPVVYVVFGVFYDANLAQRNNELNEKFWTKKWEKRDLARSRDLERQAIMKRKSQALDNDDFKLYDELDKELKALKKEWEEEDFRQRLLETLEEK